MLCFKNSTLHEYLEEINELFELIPGMGFKNGLLTRVRIHSGSPAGYDAVDY